MENFSKIIEDWYKGNARDLPWRHSRDPYKIWISEIILQQTQVKQGHDYYLRFIHRFPDVRTLAAADEQEVLKYWQGLGYYSRARNILASAREIVHDREGVFPADYDSIRSLKGIGDYTAAAICSFAYGLPEAVLDGNVYRVLSRYFGIATPIDTTAGKRQFTELSRQMLDKDDPALYNQAIMDFGAVQCTPQNPACMFCPLKASCTAFGERRVKDYPFKARKTTVKDVWYTYLYINYKRMLFLHRRSGNGIWKNMYELPLIESHSEEEQERIVHSTEFSLWTRIMPEGEPPMVHLLATGMKHVLSHRIIHAACYLLAFNDSPALTQETFRRAAKANGCIAIDYGDVVDFPLPRLIAKLMERGQEFLEIP